MRHTKLFIALCFSLCISSITYANDEWTPASFDRRKAIKNDSSAPAKLSPLNELPPLTQNEGVIRRVRLPEGVKAVALTFDMCELDTVTTGCDMESLSFLRENQIPATLFMGGKWMRTHARRVKQIMKEGALFEIANHNWSHGNCALLSEEGLKAQILWTQAEYELLREESGVNDIPNIPELFRLPYGRNNERALKVIAGLGLRVVQWDVAAEAGDNSNMTRAKRNAKIVTAMTRPGSILLFHANLVPKGTVNLLREVVNILEGDGYMFVKVSELLAMGEAETVRDGYFSRPGDNYALDKKFGIDGTGRRKRFTGKP